MKNKKILVVNESLPSAPRLRGVFCQSFLCRLKGLMFTSSIPNNFGLLLVEAKESQVNSAIHMFFMKFDISVIWLDQNYQIVDTVIAKKGHALYAPSKPAKYTLETSVENFTFFQPGNQLQVIFDE